MIHNDVLNQLQLLIKTSAPPLIEVAQTPLEEAQWVPGQRLTATVLASLPNGRFQVLVGDMALDMNLPRNTQPGEQVELTFVSNQPRLTFALSRDLPALAGNSLPADAKPQVSISDSVRYLGALLQKISEQAEAQSAPINKSAPVLSAAPSDIKGFAASLRNTLSQSGLFYESHQAQWVAGERKLTDLLQEPQGKLSTLNPSGPGAESLQKNVPASIQSDVLLAQTASMKSVLSLDVTKIQQQMQNLGVGAEAPQMDGVFEQITYSKPVVAPDIIKLQQQLQNPGAGAEALQKNGPVPSQSDGFLAKDVARVQPQSQNLGASAEITQKNASVLMRTEGLVAQSASRMPVHAEAITLVQQQLQTLDTRQLVWQGQVWQGQSMEWRVEERGAREGGVGEVEMPHWQTSLRLQLPRLGDVQAMLAFTAQGLRIDLKAADASTAEAMRDAQGKLLSSMEASGLNVLAMSVERHEKT